MRSLAIGLVTVALAATPALAAEDAPDTKSHAVLWGTVIGLAAGTAGGALFFGLSDCHYGSDSAAAMVGCGAVTGGIIAAGGITGHLIGHRVAKRSAPRPSDARTAEWQELGERVSMNFSFGAHTPPSAQKREDVDQSVPRHEGR
jgi:hypothetical protein